MTDRELLQTIYAQIGAHLQYSPTTPVVPPPPPPPPTSPVVGAPVMATYAGRGNVQYINTSGGQVWCAPLPDTGGATTGSIIVGEVPGSPQPVKVELCISKTKGLIDTAGNYMATHGNTNAGWFTKAYSIINSFDAAKARGYMWAPVSEGPWFVNIRLSPSGPMQTSWNNGPWA
jgi:hypothetical protein